MFVVIVGCYKIVDGLYVIVYRESVILPILFRFPF